MIRADSEKRVITLPYEDIVQCAVPTKREVGSHTAYCVYFCLYARLNSANRDGILVMVL